MWIKFQTKLFIDPNIILPHKEGENENISSGILEMID